MADEASEILELLTLLRSEAPLSSFEEVVRRARTAGATSDALDRLTQAKEASLGIRELFAHRKHREAGLSNLLDIARDLALPHDLETLFRVITRRARLLLDVDMAWVTCADPHGEGFWVRAADGHSAALPLGYAPPTGGDDRPADDRQVPFWSADYENDHGVARSPALDAIVRAEGLRALVAVPLRHQGVTLGVLYAADRLVRRFAPDEIASMSTLADLAAPAIETTRLLERAQHGGVIATRDSRATDPVASRERAGAHSVRLLDVVLRDGSLSAVTAEAAKGLPGTLLIRDVDGHVLVCCSGEPPALDEAEIRGVVLDAQISGRPLLTRQGVWVASVAAGDQLLGTLILVPKAPIADDQVELLALTAQITAVVLLIEHGMAAAKDQLRDEFFDRLLRGPALPSEQLIEHGRQFAVDLDEPHVVVIARPEQGVKGRALAWAASYARRHNGLKCVDGEIVGLLLPGSDPATAAREVSEELSEVLGGPVTTGSAGPARHPAQIAGTYQEAGRCLDAVTALSGSGSTASLRQLGFLGLLLSGRPDVSWFIDSTIGPVLDYDDQQSTELVRTLEAYFASAHSPSRAAESLYVHPNTVSRRLERISELLGSDWQKPARALQVQLALQLQRTRQALNRADPSQAEGRAGSGPLGTGSA